MSTLRINPPKKDQERIARIYERFMQGAYLSTKELAGMEEVSQKTIQNDIKPFVQSGILKKDGRRYFMPKEFRNEEILREAQMSISMMSALFSKVFPQIETSYVFQKSPKNGDKFYFNFTMEKILDESILANIIYAMEKRIAIEFAYINRDTKSGKKSVYPLKVANYDGIWYLVAHDLSSEIIKTFHINHILSLKILEESFLSFEKIENLESEAKKITSPWYNAQLKTVRLRVEGVAREYIKRKNYQNIKILSEEEDKITLEMRYFNDTEVLQFVKSWLPFVKIENNEKLREELKKVLEESLAQF